MELTFWVQRKKISKVANTSSYIMSPCGEMVIAVKKIEYSSTMLLSKVQHYLIHILTISFCLLYKAVCKRDS